MVGLGGAETNHAHCMDFLKDATELHKQYISMEVTHTAGLFWSRAGGADVETAQSDARATW